MSNELYTPLLLEWINTWIDENLYMHKYTKIYYKLLEDNFKLIFEDLLIPIGFDNELNEVINASIPVLTIKHIEISKYSNSYENLVQYLETELNSSKTYKKYISRLDK